MNEIELKDFSKHIMDYHETVEIKEFKAISKETFDLIVKRSFRGVRSDFSNEGRLADSIIGWYNNKNELIAQEYQSHVGSVYYQY